MRNQSEEMIKSLNYEIEERQRSIEKIKNLPVNLVCQAFPSANWSNCWGSMFECTLPYNFALIAEVKEFMKDQFPGAELRYETQHIWERTESADAGYFLDYYQGGEKFFQFGFRTGKPGTTCVLNKIGEKSVPVYEVICGDGAKENTFAEAGQ